MMHSMASPRAIGLTDALVAGIAVAFGLVLMIANVTDPDSGVEPSSWVVIPGFLLVTLPVLWRRTAPLAALGAVAIGMAVNVAFLGEAVRCGVAFPVVWLLVFSGAAR